MIEPTPTFRLADFNPRRAQRGRESARVEFTWSDGETEYLWMSAHDIMKNLETWGDSEELNRALAAYQQTAHPDVRRSKIRENPGLS